MRFITTLVHGMLDYLTGILLIASPWLFNFSRGGAETLIPVILGAGLVIYSLFTNYELGAVKRLSMATHLWLDALSGAVLALSPWLFNFNEYVYLPHLIFGVAEVGAALMTKTIPDTTKGHALATDAVREANTVGASRQASSRANNLTNPHTTTDRPAMGSGADAMTHAERKRAERNRLR